MDNWLLIIVAVIFVVCIVVGYVRGFLKFGLSLLSTVLTLVLVAILSPYVADALAKYTPVDDFIEERVVEAFMPEIPVDDLANVDLSGTPLEDLDPEELANLNDENWDMLGITAQDILDVIGEIPKDTQIKEIENAAMPQFLKDMLLENNNTTIYEELGVKSFPEYVASYISRMVLNLISFCYIPDRDHHSQGSDVRSEYNRRASCTRPGEPHRRRRAGSGARAGHHLAGISHYHSALYDRGGKCMF